MEKIDKHQAFKATSPQTLKPIQKVCACLKGSPTSIPEYYKD